MLAKPRSYTILNILANVVIGGGLGLVLFFTTGQALLLVSSGLAGVVGSVIAARVHASSTSSEAEIAS